MDSQEKDKSINDENNDNEYGEHDDAIERFLDNPDAVIARGWFRYLLKVKSGCIADISEVEQMLYDTATDFEYHLHGLDRDHYKTGANLSGMSEIWDKPS